MTNTLQKILGKDVFNKIQSSKTLVVGAGGIGCELLKDLVLSGFNNIVIVDLDVIDLSNLNRQFLFQKQHIKKPKAFVARETALQFNPSAQIQAFHDSIFDPSFDVSWFKSFDLVLNALDNVNARRHVNMMCQAADVPLVESGTAGFLGQVSVHKKDQTACYDCDPKSSGRKTYPVCTIRSTPSDPIHCIVWAKSYLYSILFGQPDEEMDISTESNSDNTLEIEELEKEAAALKLLRTSLGTDKHFENIFKKIFKTDIERLLQIDDLWKSRKKPAALILENYKDLSNLNHISNTLEFDQKPWSVLDNIKMFKSSLAILSKDLLEKRLLDPEYTLAFDKDDEQSLNFVTSAANLRAHIFGIQQKSRFDVKEMAGNIIPAIATTNAIVAGMIVMLAFKILAGQLEKCQYTYVTYNDRTMLLQNAGLPKPNINCSVCSNTFLELTLNTETSTLGLIVNRVLTEIDILGDITVEEGGRLLYDIEFDDNLQVTLKDLNIGHGARLTVTNENDEEPLKNYSIIFMIKHSIVDGFEIQGDKRLKSRPLPVKDLMPEQENKRKLEIDQENTESKKKRKEEEVIDDEDMIL